MKTTTSVKYEFSLEDVREMVANKLGVKPEAIQNLDSIIKTVYEPSPYPSDGYDIDHFDGIKAVIIEETEE